MSNTYIKFKVSNAKGRKTPESIRRIVMEKILTTIIPVANPDFEDKINDVASWLIEFENDSYFPNREIGLNAADKPIVIMPWGNNYGYWTDNNLVIKDFRTHFETIDIARPEFESYWNLFQNGTA